MSSEARILGLIEDAVRRETEPLKQAVEELSGRLAAVEGSSDPSDTEPAKRPARGRGARAKAQPAEASVTADDSGAEAVPTQRKASE